MKNNKKKVYQDYFYFNLPTKVEIEYCFEGVDVKEIDEDELDKIGNDIENGYIRGNLFYTDENDIEHQGWWKLVQLF